MIVDITETYYYFLTNWIIPVFGDISKFNIQLGDNVVSIFYCIYWALVSWGICWLFLVFPFRLIKKICKGSKKV